ncbi:MAG TPA: carboxypeptidase-like regulatory domain-containing protein [Planctomycetota bacterium]|nr:carboxypeptidase-like regulatory domain-containing protein [Planctomycetota bacterium]
MNNKFRILLLAMVLVGGLGFFWLQREPAQDTGHPGLAESTEIEPAEPQPTSPGAAPLAELVPSDTPVEPQRSVVLQDTQPEASPEDQARAPIEAKAQAIWIEGVVDVPDGTPADESIEIEARGKVFPGSKNERRTHRVRMQPDGRFRVAVAPDSLVASISLLGQYACLREPYVWRIDQEESVVLEPVLGGCLEYEVLLPPGANGPIQNWSANLTGRYYPHPHNLSLDANNRFLVPGIAPNSWQYLTVSADGYAKFAGSVDDVEPGTRKVVPLHLEPECILRGKVTDEAGNPVAEGRVNVDLVEDGVTVNYVGPRVDGLEVVGGHYEARGLAEGTYKIEFQASGILHEPVTTENLVPGEAREVNLHVSHGKAIEGTVHWSSGAPAVGVEVKLMQPTGSGMRQNSARDHSSQTDAAGRFSLSGFEDDGPFALVALGVPPSVVRPEGMSKLKTRRWERENTVQAIQDGVIPGGPPIALVLGKGAGGIAGQVVNEAGEPIRSFRVTAAPRMGMTEEVSLAGAKRDRFQDPDGKFVLEGLADGWWGVQASAAGHRDGEMVWVEVPATQDIQVVLPRASSITGKVLSADGRTVEAQVSLEPVTAEDSDPYYRSEEGTQSSVASGFRFSGLDAGTWKLTATKDGYFVSEPITLELGLGEEREGVELRLPPAGTIRGTVHPDWWAPGLAVSLHQVQKTEHGHTENQSLPDVTVDSKGQFEALDIPAGTYVGRLVQNRIQQESENSHGPMAFAFASDPFEELALGQTEEVDVVAGQVAVMNFAGPGSDAVILTGRLLEGSEPAKGWRISFRGQNPHRDQVEALSGEGGRYRVVLGGAGRYQVGFDSPERSGEPPFQNIELPNAGPQNLDLVLPTGTLILELQLPDGSEPGEYSYAGAFALTPKDGHQRIQAARIEGKRVYFENLSPDSYSLGRASVYARSRTYISEPMENIEFPGGQTPFVVPLTMVPGCKLEGTVQGYPSDKQYFVVYAFDAQVDGNYLEAQMTHDGEFSFDSLPQGDVWLSTTYQANENKPRTRATLVPGSIAHTQLPYWAD